jgi:hypothetical protein
MVLSDYPLVWGWKVVLRFNFVPKAYRTFGNNREVNSRSRSEKINTGTPCNLTILSIYNFANFSTESIILKGKKKCRFSQLVMMTQTASLPFSPQVTLIRSLSWCFITSTHVSVVIAQARSVSSVLLLPVDISHTLPFTQPPFFFLHIRPPIKFF